MICSHPWFIYDNEVRVVCFVCGRLRSSVDVFRAVATKKLTPEQGGEMLYQLAHPVRWWHARPRFWIALDLVAVFFLWMEQFRPAWIPGWMR